MASKSSKDPATLRPIDCSIQPLDIAFHPLKENLLATALVDGTLEVHDISQGGQVLTNDENNDEDENDTILSSIPVHTQQLPAAPPSRRPPPTEITDSDAPPDNNKLAKASCRAVLFSNNGDRIFTGGSMGDVCGLDSERACCLGADESSILWRFQNNNANSSDCSSSAIHVLHQLPATAPCGPLLVTGDDNGGIRFWDERVQSKTRAVMGWNENTDYISGFDHSPDGCTLVASSADCALSVVDLRKAANPTMRPECFRRSDDQEDELLSVKVIKGGKKVVCGTSQGVLSVWSFGTWGDVSDRFPGHPCSIDALLKVDEDTLLTGSLDGLIRLVQVQPDKLLGVLGSHEDYPVEKLAFNATQSVVGSVSHDNLVRLFDATILQDNDEDDEEEEDDDSKEKQDEKVGPAAVAVAKHASDDDWSDDDDDNEEERDSDDSDDSSDDGKQETTNDRRAKRFKTENEKFFEDL